MKMRCCSRLQLFLRCVLLLILPAASQWSEDSGVTLLQLIGDPPPEKIPEVDGPDNSPAYLFGPESATGQLARAHFPNPFYRNFALIFSLKPTSDDGGIVFSITDSSQQVMHLGVKLSAVQGSEQNVILFYSEAGTRQSKEAARFRVPSMTNAWNRFAVAVKDDKAMLYLNCDVEPQVMRMERSAGELELESGSGVFVGQAGGEHPDKFKVGKTCPMLDILVKTLVKWRAHRSLFN
ncbi:PREDICTED: collagen alpha-1(XVIII) chain-like isoform X2 [Poecilia mexicana]|uniref:collagen alpha-1(XVIII) chain-like isoform X2 n=1 Tax=Poecilia mexicana TaxID=48701 RepID=UPI00072EE738|nr:PREDICTED: collagen alpha-1(XVIII) chain-like isoform X2 [Poecilia mexicana]